MSYALSPNLTVIYGSRVADPDTSSPDHMGFLDIPRLHDGRIWTDKSVRVNTGTGADDFTVIFSALSQSFYMSDGYVVPTDTVFIIDISGSMFMESIGGRPRAAVMVDALNEAMGILLDANPRNRIAVVAYGGNTGGFSRAEDILPLGRPLLLQGATDFFTYRPAGGNNYVDVHTTNRLTTSVLVQGSTPTQLGILYGANVLASANELTIPALSPTGDPVVDAGGNPYMITRQPNFILLTDGEPTMAWSDYLFTVPPTATNQNYGDGINGETGVSLLTVLTAAHRKRLVHHHYYEDNPNHTTDVLNFGSIYEKVGFYTISLNDVPPPLLISAAMYPFPNDLTSGYADMADPSLNVNTVGGPYPSSAPTDTMGKLLRDFSVPFTTINFYAQYRFGLGDYRWQDVTISNSQELTLEEIAFADAFFPANDLSTLREAFTSIAIDLQKESFSSITDTDPGQEEFDGYLVFSDVLGDYMEFRDITRFEFDGVNYNRSGFGQAIIENTNDAKTSYEDILYHHMNYGNMPGIPGFDTRRYVSKPQIVALIESNIKSGYLAENNCIKYYAYSNRDYAGSFFHIDGTESVKPAGAVATVDVFPMWGTLNAPVFSGGATELMYITFHVVTALADMTGFEEIFNTDNAGKSLTRTLNKGDQMLRWYIPAVMIPQRTVDTDTGDVSGNLLPIRIHYRVGLNEPLIRAGVPESYINRHSVGEHVYFYTNHNPENVTLAFFQPNELNPFYQLGRPGYSERGVLKTSNPTDTASHVTLINFSYRSDGVPTDIQWLGNNGRLTVDLPKLPELPDPPVVERSPQTGTFSRLTPYVIILILSITLTVGIILSLSGKKLISALWRNSNFLF